MTISVSSTVEYVKRANKVKADLQADHAFFVFGDLGVKVPGSFRLKFNLFEMHKMYVQMMCIKH